MAELLQVFGYYNLQPCRLGFQLIAFAAHGHEVDLGFFLEGIAAARNVEMWAVVARKPPMMWPIRAPECPRVRIPALRDAGRDAMRRIREVQA